MTIDGWLILAFWLILIAVWAGSAGNAKRSIVGGWGWRREIALRLAILAIILLVLRLTGVRHALSGARLYALNRSAVAGIVGVMFCGLGAGLAIIARIHLGRNWGMPMSRKENPELVTSGPYAYVRHPIYTGMLIAMLGSTIGVTPFWSIPLVLFGLYFVYSARKEEKLMMEQFPEQYAAYMRRTKMLMPFIL